MRNSIKVTAIVAAAALLFSLSGIARADDHNNRRGMSTTEKVVTGVAIAAAVGLAAYAIAKSDDHRYYEGNYYGPRNYVAFEYGFSPYAVGGPYGAHYRGRQGYWHDNQGYRFYRVPYVYNNRYDNAFNAGWERGYWAGYMQGLNDARMRGHYYDRFQWNGGGPLWGYERGFGGYSSYERGFMSAFGVGYRHAYYGQPYGSDGFGFGFSYGYRR
jgi:hypothetical protein